MDCGSRISQKLILPLARSLALKRCFVGLIKKKHGEISPAEFIPIVETFGLIVPIGVWVLRKACERLVECKATGLPPIPIAVNLSAV